MRNFENKNIEIDVNVKMDDLTKELNNVDVEVNGINLTKEISSLQYRIKELIKIDVGLRIEKKFLKNKLKEMKHTLEMIESINKDAKEKGEEEIERIGNIVQKISGGNFLFYKEQREKDKKELEGIIKKIEEDLEKVKLKIEKGEYFKGICLERLSYMKALLRKELKQIKGCHICKKNEFKNDLN